MLDGWYCRSIANTHQNDEEDEIDEPTKYKHQYKNLKRKLKYLIYENECFQDALKSAQRRLLTVTRDRSFLLDRLLQYERVDVSSSESEDTESSDDPDMAKIEVKKKKIDSAPISHGNGIHVLPSMKGQVPPVKKKRPTTPRQPKPIPRQSPVPLQTVNTLSTNMASDGHMTPEEVERHLQSRQSYVELVPEKAPPTVPTEMFSNDPSLESDSNDLETSPSNMGEDLSVDMIAE